MLDSLLQALASSMVDDQIANLKNPEFREKVAEAVKLFPKLEDQLAAAPTDQLPTWATVENDKNIAMAFAQFMLGNGFGAPAIAAIENGNWFSLGLLTEHFRSDTEKFAWLRIVTSYRAASLGYIERQRRENY